jgi:hypothetical protein
MEAAIKYRPPPIAYVMNGHENEELNGLYELDPDTMTSERWPKDWSEFRYIKTSFETDVLDNAKPESTVTRLVFTRGKGQNIWERVWVFQRDSYGDRYTTSIRNGLLCDNFPPNGKAVGFWTPAHLDHISLEHAFAE